MRDFGFKKNYPWAILVFSGVLGGNAKADIPNINCNTDISIFNTGHPSAADSSRDKYWSVTTGYLVNNRATYTIPNPMPSEQDFSPSYLIDATQPGNENLLNRDWTGRIAESKWVSITPNGAQGLEHLTFVFRYEFNLLNDVDLSIFAPKFNFYVDNSIYDVFVNGVSQKDNTPGLPSSFNSSGNFSMGPDTNYGFTSLGFKMGNEASFVLDSNFQIGNNTIDIVVRSDPGYMGFLAGVTGDRLCKSVPVPVPVNGNWMLMLLATSLGFLIFRNRNSFFNRRA